MKKSLTLALAALAVITLIPAFAPAPSQAAVGAEGVTQVSPSHIDLNTATTEDLLSISGIGPALAEKIVALRTRRGGFRSLDDLLEVRGIGPKSLEKIRPFLTLSAPSSPAAASPSHAALP